MQRTQRMVEKNKEMLADMQKERREREAQQMEEAKRLQQLNEMKGLAYDPKADGFVFSNDKIRHEIDREDRLNQSGNVRMTRAMRKRLRRLAA